MEPPALPLPPSSTSTPCAGKGGAAGGDDGGSEGGDDGGSEGGDAVADATKAPSRDRRQGMLGVRRLVASFDATP